MKGELSIMGPPGFEPGTSAMSRRRHNHLDHEPSVTAEEIAFIEFKRIVIKQQVWKSYGAFILTQIESATDGIVTGEMKRVAMEEEIEPELLRSDIASGRTVIMTRKGGKRGVCGIGKGLRTKVNVNIGTSTASRETDLEVEKARVAEAYSADTITDLSMGGDLEEIRRQILASTTIPLTTVPIYQCVAENGWTIRDRDILSRIEEDVRSGVSSIVIHTITRELVLKLKKSRRILTMVSKGGSLTSLYMLKNNRDNPFLEHFDEILEILRERDVVLSLGNSLRSGCVHDMPDCLQREELELNARLAEEANKAGVQVIIEGMGGHVAPALIPESVRYHKEVADRPLFVAGPLPTDVAVGYDHIAASIGAALASGAGADYLCAVTPAEHICLPGVEDVREGLTAFRIAAHIGDSIKYMPSDRDRRLAVKRSMLDWSGQLSHAIEPRRPEEMRRETGGICSMCGEYCAILRLKEYL